MGIARFATLSDGNYFAPLNSFKRQEKALVKAQRAMSRKQKFSNNWKKAKANVQLIHARIGNARRDYLHKATTTFSQNHAMVCIEDLQVRNMSKSASGTPETPAGRVRVADMSPKRTGSAKRGSSVWTVVSRKTPIWSVLSMC